MWTPPGRGHPEDRRSWCRTRLLVLSVAVLSDAVGAAAADASTAGKTLSPFDWHARRLVHSLTVQVRKAGDARHHFDPGRPGTGR